MEELQPQTLTSHKKDRNSSINGQFMTRILYRQLHVVTNTSQKFDENWLKTEAGVVATNINQTYKGP